MAYIMQITFPGDTTPLYLSRATTQLQLQQLQANLLAATQGSVVPAAGPAAEHGDGRPAAPAPAAQAAAEAGGVVAPAPGAAPAVSVASCAVSGPAGAGQGARKRARSGAAGGDAINNTVHQQEWGELPPPPIHLIVVDWVGDTVDFYVQRDAPFRWILDEYADIRALDPATLRFAEGRSDRVLSPDATPAQVGLEDHDWLRAYWGGRGQRTVAGATPCSPAGSPCMHNVKLAPGGLYVWRVWHLHVACLATCSAVAVQVVQGDWSGGCVCGHFVVLLNPHCCTFMHVCPDDREQTLCMYHVVTHPKGYSGCGTYAGRWCGTRAYLVLCMTMTDAWCRVGACTGVSAAYLAYNRTVSEFLAGCDICVSRADVLVSPACCVSS
jgi:hypothetical protein